jgi:hypothetical protein
LIDCGFTTNFRLEIVQMLLNVAVLDCLKFLPKSLFFDHLDPIFFENLVLVFGLLNIFSFVSLLRLCSFESRANAQQLSVSCEDACEEPAVFGREIGISLSSHTVVFFEGLLDLTLYNHALVVVVKMEVVWQAVRTLSLVVELNQLIALEL